MAGELAAAAATALLVLLEAAALAAAGLEADALLAFRATLRGPKGGPPEELSQWLDTATPEPCDGGEHWHKVYCDRSGSKVWGLRLESLGLQGPMPDLGLLAPLAGLVYVALNGNNLTGAFRDVSGLAALEWPLLLRNNLAGEIPDGTFAKLTGLRALSLENS